MTCAQERESEPELLYVRRRGRSGQCTGSDSEAPGIDTNSGQPGVELEPALKRNPVGARACRRQQEGDVVSEHWC